MYLNKTRAFHSNFHNILRLLDVFPNFLFTKSQAMWDNYKNGIYELPQELPNDLQLRKLGNIRKVLKRNSLLPSPPRQTANFDNASKKLLKNTNYTFLQCAISNKN